jgi:tRNA-specific 2-thiouridylase
MNNMLNKNKKIVVAMSGGVDSSTVAALLVEQGYEVIGMTMQLYDHGEALKKKGACCAGLDIYDARNVAEQLGIPHYVLNYESNFKSSVMDSFADSYMRGETPVPCITCNQTVKFRDMLQMAKDIGAEAIATGHYVRRAIVGDEVHLCRGRDYQKDQSYFLFTTTNEQLSFLRFPLGEYTKEETRNLARKYNLSVADKADSQDICFVPDGRYADVVSRLRPGALDPGEIVHINGEVLGTHQGIINFTIGQRKGLGVNYTHPLYVIKIDPVTKQVVVGEEEYLSKKSFIIKQVNWLLDVKDNEIEAEVKIRSAQELVPARIKLLQNNQAEVILREFSRAITPGQACVIYDNDRVLGGGWIEKVTD